LKKTLVLTFDGDNKDLKMRVYDETVRYVADNLPGADSHVFRGNKDLLLCLSKNDYESVIYTCEIEDNIVKILRSAGVVQILVGMKENLTKEADIVIDPLVHRNDKYLVGPKFLLQSALNKVDLLETADIMGIDKDTLIEEVAHNDAEDELLSVIRLYKKLEWDSDFFGENVGYISCLRLTSNIEKHIKKFVHEEKISLVEYLCNCHDRESVLESEKNGYSFVDIRLTFESFLKNVPDVCETTNSLPKGFSVRKGEEKDIERIKEIATDIYKHSRYYFDEKFETHRSKVIDFYVNWAEKAILGKFDDYAYVLYNGENPMGFCTIRRIKKNSVKIGLFGMDSECSGKGLAKKLLLISLTKLRDEENVEHVEVVTQGRNYPAQRLYQKCGFLTKATELWYHKWGNR
jgi:ribosomal protein S18 acetylase RimI-like enzyme